MAVSFTWLVHKPINNFVHKFASGLTSFIDMHADCMENRWNPWITRGTFMHSLWFKMSRALYLWFHIIQKNSFVVMRGALSIKLKRDGLKLGHCHSFQRSWPGSWLKYNHAGTYMMLRKITINVERIWRKKNEMINLRYPKFTFPTPSKTSQSCTQAELLCVNYLLEIQSSKTQTKYHTAGVSTLQMFWSLTNN